MCDSSGLTAQQLQPYTFVHCTGAMSVGKTYEAHYVHSSAAPGTDASPVLADGLGAAAGAATGIKNPMIVVEAMVFHLVNDAAYDFPAKNLTYGWHWATHSGADSVMYAGSTTGTSYNNHYCSPYTITWHVDKRCHKVSAKSFDQMCHEMKSKFNQVADLAPHSSRKLLDSQYVVPANEVLPFAM